MKHLGLLFVAFVLAIALTIGWYGTGFPDWKSDGQAGSNNYTIELKSAHTDTNFILTMGD